MVSPVHFNRATYMVSAHHKGQWPPDTGAEVAFAGRSNTGKSSALNAICGQKRLAKTGKMPGRTRQINFFALSDSMRLVDLPGYGFANAPLGLRRHWLQFVSEYLTARESLRALMLLCDMRRGLGDADMALLESCKRAELAVYVVLTKADKFKRARAQSALQQVREQLAVYSGVGVQAFSATKKIGVSSAQKTIADFLQA